jgi:tetratricopeptide (TPR) repeat protein
MKSLPWSLVALALAASVGLGAFLWSRRARPAPAPEPARAPTPSAELTERRPLLPEPAAALAPEVDALEPDEDWVELNNAATNELAAGELAAAVAALERCHAARPDNAVFAANLAEACVRLAVAEHERGELAAALAHLARALEVGSERADRATLERLLERWRRESELAEDDWTEESSRFELAYDTDRADILHRSHEVLEHLEQSYDELVRFFGRDPLADAPPIRVVLYDPADFDRLTGLGDWAAGLFDGVVRVSVHDLGAGPWRAVLVHELAHAFVHALRGNEVPGWLNEGLAQLLEGRASDVALLRARLAGAEPFSLERLAGSLAGWQERDAIARAYAQSLVFVVYLRDTYGEEALRRMLDGGPESLSVAAAFERFTGVALELAFQDWCATLAR